MDKIDQAINNMAIPRQKRIRVAKHVIEKQYRDGRVSLNDLREIPALTDLLHLKHWVREFIDAQPPTDRAGARQYVRAALQPRLNEKMLRARLPKAAHLLEREDLDEMKGDDFDTKQLIDSFDLATKDFKWTPIPYWFCQNPGLVLP